MKTKTRLFALTLGLFTLFLTAAGETEERNLPVFTEVSLRIPAKLYIHQGDVQKVTIDAASAILEEIITEIKDRSLVIRFPAKKYIWDRQDPGKIVINITIPELTGLHISGSGNIYGEGPVSTLIMDLSLSGSGNINLSNLSAERIKASISGSGNIMLKGEKPASQFSGSIAGSGNIKAENLEAHDVKVTIAGSGNCGITSNGNITVKIAGSGNFYYAGNPNIDSSVAGSGRIREIK